MKRFTSGDMGSIAHELPTLIDCDPFTAQVVFSIYIYIYIYIKLKNWNMFYNRCLGCR